MFFRNGLEPWHLLILALVFMTLFGATRLPGAAKGVAQSLRIFRSELKSSDDREPVASSAQPPAAAASPIEQDAGAPATKPSSPPGS